MTLLDDLCEFVRMFFDVYNSTIDEARDEHGLVFAVIIDVIVGAMSFILLPYGLIRTAVYHYFPR